MPLTLKESNLFKTLLENTFDEVFIFETSSLHLIAVSSSLIQNHETDLVTLQTKEIEDLLEISPELIKHHISVAEKQHSLNKGKASDLIYTEEASLKLTRFITLENDYLIVIKNDATSLKAISKVLKESETRFQSILSNTPGLVCQFRLDAEGNLLFDYLSNRAQELLGFTAEQLKLNHRIFYKMINPRDRTLLRMRLKLSKTELSEVNWDGRVWIDAWQDTKWINMRSTPKKLPNGDVQWDGFITNITQSMDEKFEIEESRRRLAELTAHMNEIREDERNKIACEIHDDLGGNLTAVKIGLASIMQSIENNQPINLEKLQQLDNIVDRTYESIHRISSDLRPNIIELGIVAALDWQSKEFEKQFNTPCFFKASDAEITIDSDQAMALFRICQEAMSNIAKYAHATEVNVSISQQGHDLEMHVIDNGIGIKPIDKLKDHSFGLRGMQERVAALNGFIKISRLRNGKRGTHVFVKLPVNKSI